MHQSIIMPLAIEDINKAFAWYESKRLGLGDEFIDLVMESVELLCSHPRIAAVRYDDTLTFVLKRFPFMIHYIIDEEREAIVVTGVYHTSMSPKKWKER